MVQLSALASRVLVEHFRVSVITVVMLVTHVEHVVLPGEIFLLSISEVFANCTDHIRLGHPSDVADELLIVREECTVLHKPACPRPGEGSYVPVTSGTPLVLA